MTINTNPIQKVLSLYVALDGRECTFDTRDDAFLAQFGIRRLTGLRDSYKQDHTDQTRYDKAMDEAGLTGAINSCSVQDFIIEKDGIQMSVFVEWGIWAVGRNILLPGSEKPYFLSKDEIRSAFRESVS